MPHNKNILAAICAWLLALVMFFPILWMALASFKTELAAVSEPALFFAPTLENYAQAFTPRANYFKHAFNSVAIALLATAVAMIAAAPAAWSMAFYPTKRTKFVLLWMLSTKMLPPVGVLVPVYLIFRDFGLLDTLTGLAAVFALINLPIMVWMLYTYFKEVPADILEAARMDGAGFFGELFFVLLPMTAGAFASTCLLSVILSWNEAFWSIHLTASDAAMQNHPNSNIGAIAIMDAADNFAQNKPSGLENDAINAVKGAASEAVR